MTVDEAGNTQSIADSELASLAAQNAAAVRDRVDEGPVDFDCVEDEDEDDSVSCDWGKGKRFRVCFVTYNVGHGESRGLKCKADWVKWFSDKIAAGKPYSVNGQVVDQNCALVWFVLCEEHAPSTGALHWHAGLRTTKPLTIGQWRTLMGEKGDPLNGKYEMMKCTKRDKLDRYLSKEDKNPAEEGVCGWSKDGNKQGQRNDLLELRHAVMPPPEGLGMTDKELAKSEKFFGIFIKHHIAIRKWRSTMLAPDPDEIDVVTQLRQWQTKAVEMIENQNDREILFIVDKTGNSGKTCLCKWLMRHKGAGCFRGGKHSDIAEAYNYEEIVVFDMARASDQEKWPWQPIESFKDGMIFSGKYQSQNKICKNPVKVVVLANVDIDMDRLSEDRYRIIEKIGDVWHGFGARRTDSEGKCVWLNA